MAELKQEESLLLQDEVDALIEKPPPSVNLDTPMLDSYTYHSARSAASNDKDSYWMGIDEAGRGPVLGPQVYSVAFCKESYSKELSEMGFADSKTLSHEKRLQLLSLICSCPDDLKWAVRVMSPHDISKGMLRKSPYNLNQQSHDATCLLIQEVLNKGYNVRQCWVDTVGDARSYQQKLSATFPTITFVVESKADYKYPIVGAASIAAKVTRDACMACWTYLESRPKIQGEVLGSGYPSDPKTVAWMEENLDPIFGFPNIARFSWATVKNMLERKGAKLQWNDEPPKIQRYFASSNSSDSTQMKQSRTALWRDLGLSSVIAF